MVLTTSVTELRDVTCHVRSHSYLLYPTQVNAARSKPARRLVLDLPTPQG